MNNESYESNGVKIYPNKIRAIKNRIYLFERINEKNKTPDTKMVNQIRNIVEEVADAYQED